MKPKIYFLIFLLLVYCSVGNAAEPTLQDCADCPVMIKLDSAIAMGQTEVTETQFRFFLKRTGYNAGAAHTSVTFSPRQAAVNVEWSAASAYVRWLSRYTGSRYRLPTEAEWNYAARAGKSSRYWWGDVAVEGCGKEHLSLLFYPMESPCESAPKQDLIDVASLQANPLGFYDILGNAGEWVFEGKACGAPSFSSRYHPAACATDFEINPAHTGLRVVRELP